MRYKIEEGKIRMLFKDITTVGKQYFFRLSARQCALSKHSCFAPLTAVATFPGSRVLIWRGISEYFIYTYII